MAGASESFRTFTRSIIGMLEWCAVQTLPPTRLPAHLGGGVRGEEEAFFPLRKLGGSTIVARNQRSLRYRGEIDLIGWDPRDGEAAEAAVDPHNVGKLRRAAP